jgi:DNA polymerase
MKRPELSQKDIETMLVAFKSGTIKMFSTDLKRTASSCVRAVILADPGKVYVCSDFKAIEGRVLAWLADDRPAVKVYTDKKDPYVVNAQALYGVKYEEVTDAQRLAGKVMELSLGYGGGEGAFNLFAGTYHLDLTDIDVKHAIRVWRGNRQITVDFWHETEKMFLAALANPGEIFSLGIRGVQLRYDGKFLYCKLPSGRIMHYFKPEARMLPTPWGDVTEKFTYMGIKSGKGGGGHWTRVEAFYGVLVENLVQAIARDILSDTMFMAEAAGFPLILHVHDEVLAELNRNTADGKLAELEKIMSITPKWAAGLPMGAAGWMGMRYQK